MVRKGSGMELTLARAYVPVTASSPSAATASMNRNVHAVMIIQIAVFVTAKAM